MSVHLARSFRSRHSTGSTQLALSPLLEATKTIPIVFVNVYDPVALGFTSNLSKPTGNVTGFTLGEFSLGSKMLELLRQIAPQTIHVTVLLNPGQSGQAEMLKAIEQAAPTLGMETTSLFALNRAELSNALEQASSEAQAGLLVLPIPIFFTYRHEIVDLVAKLRIPAVYALREFSAIGGLASLSVDSIEQHRRAGEYAGRILNGTKVVDLPVQQPTAYRSLINLRTAKQMDLAIPPTLLAVVDEVIE
jgi:putative ABC transport system substrate-binding protein